LKTSENKAVDIKNKRSRHILALSGGKDSSALAVYLKDRIPEIEYVFCDTGEELPETYDFIRKLQDFLSKEIKWLQSKKNFQYYLDLYKGVLPDVRARWCTRMLKIRPYEEFIGNDEIISYVGIRADEPDRIGYISTKPNISVVYPFKENNIRKEDVLRMLKEVGLGLPSYYSWRSRSGCYFCFFQQKIEWVGLLENHPKLFKKAMDFEKIDSETGAPLFTWIQGESLKDLAKPERIERIKNEFERRLSFRKGRLPANCKLKDIFVFEDEEDSFSRACNICHL